MAFCRKYERANYCLHISLVWINSYRCNAIYLKAIVEHTFIVGGIDDMHRTRNDAGRLLQVDDAL